VPEYSEPIPPKVSADEALEVARRHLRDPSAKLTKAAILDQNDRGPGSLDWLLEVLTEPPPPSRVVKPDGTVEEYQVSGAGLHRITVDALTGEVVEDVVPRSAEAIAGAEPEQPAPPASVASVVPSAEPVTNAGGTPAVPVVPLAGAGVVLVLAVGALVVIRRRK
jgi:hypothetical protein